MEGQVADASIFAGVALVLLFRKRFFGKQVGESSAEEGDTEGLVAEAVVSESSEDKGA